MATCLLFRTFSYFFQGNCLLTTGNLLQFLYFLALCAVLFLFLLLLKRCLTWSSQTEIWNLCKVPFTVMNGHYKYSTVIEKVTYFRSANPLWQPLSAAVLLHVQGWSHHDRSRARSSYHEAKESSSWARPFLCGRWYHENLDALRFDWRSQPPTAGMLKRDPGQDLVICFFSASYRSRIALLPKWKSRKGNQEREAFESLRSSTITNK